MMKFIYGASVFTPAGTILGIDSSTSTSVVVNVISHTQEAGATDVTQSKYTITCDAGNEIKVAKALIEEINFGKLDVVDLAAFLTDGEGVNLVTNVTFTA